MVMFIYPDDTHASLALPVSQVAQSPDPTVSVVAIRTWVIQQAALLPDFNSERNQVGTLAAFHHLTADKAALMITRFLFGIPRGVPLVVQQWEGLIAINCAACAAGISGRERVHHALKKCRDLQCVHVETIGDEIGNSDSPIRRQAKVSLDRYRQLHSSEYFSDVCEKVSIY
ncbi:hypothetical protein R1sor_023526 [Riccia sorocarpa]|uniref:UmuC domain-containing protein n=1 Tax=Riccia sorocarpa TaxID=122646 RepID=A0ABD3GR46_9MARC